MKKIVLFAMMMSIAIFVLGCSALDPLSQFENEAKQNITTIEAYESIEESEDLTTLSMETPVLLNSTLDASEDQVAYIRNLYSEILSLHALNVLDYEVLASSWVELKNHVTDFRATENQLSISDKTEIRAIRRSLIEQRIEIAQTRGQIWELLLELQGLYDIDHLDLIQTNFEEIKSILLLRGAYITFVRESILDVDDIVLSYLS